MSTKYIINPIKGNNKSSITIDFGQMQSEWSVPDGKSGIADGITKENNPDLLSALHNAGYSGPDTIKKLEKAISIANTKENKDEILISNLQSVLKKEQDKDKKEQDKDKKDEILISNLQSHLKKEQDKNKNLSTLNIALIITSSVLFIALLISLFLKGKKR